MIQGFRGRAGGRIHTAGMIQGFRGGRIHTAGMIPGFREWRIHTAGMIPGFRGREDTHSRGDPGL